jgi:hypothetical protein
MQIIELEIVQKVWSSIMPQLLTMRLAFLIRVLVRAVVGDLERAYKGIGRVERRLIWIVAVKFWLSKDNASSLAWVTRVSGMVRKRSKKDLSYLYRKLRIDPVCSSNSSCGRYRDTLGNQV